MNKDRLLGAGKQVIGSAKQVVGKLFGDAKLLVDGNVRPRRIIMRISLRQTAFATTAIIALSAFAAAAAPSAGDPTATRATPTTSGQSVAKHHPGVHHDMVGKVEQRITDLHARLQITPAQQPQWDQFIQVMRDNAQTMDQTFQHRVQTMPAMTATENMQSYAQLASTNAQDAQKLVPAFQALYDTMSDTQKRTADQVFRDDAHHGGHTQHG
jgi:periplasmic protein CpxP/Spy